MDTFHQQHENEALQAPKLGFWEKCGGGALSIAIMIHLVLAIGGGILIVQEIWTPAEDPGFVSGTGDPGKGNRAQAQAKPKQFTPVTYTENLKRVIAIGAKSTYAIPDPGETFGEKSALVSLTGDSMSGSLDGPGDGLIGSGPNSGPGPNIKINSNKKPFDLIPPSWSKRCSKNDRLARLKENGGTPACEDAVVKGLQWLKANQNPDGSWGPQKNAMTGLALLAYFGHCETPLSDEFGESCLKAIVYLVNEGVKNNGLLTANMKSQPAPYEHAIATYALAEAATFCKEIRIEVPNLMEVTEKAGQIIIDNQSQNGGWAYGYNKASGGHTDTSIVGWQLQALKACSHTSIKFKGMNSAVDKGLDYLVTCQAPDGSFGYSGPGGRTGLTGVGVLCHQMWGKDKSKPVRNGVKFIKENFKMDWENADLYSHYYASQAMMQAGGSNWKSYNSQFRDELLKNQNPDGSWKTPGHKLHGASPVYINTLCVLMLEVYYRFLNSSGGQNQHPSF